ncbi:FAD/NAD(P)-binding domain-containing protein [Sphaerulina musiva SO2202]|uniref:FAD/NAD(P)-binding domain-containing protein n=1 Tax=Sphaerulina musiva (strain SO2202) TaxID=692275 RepID=N1QNW2_SPHMS|nr:FAD/NAD(P)-binding domain-containing protein [Sphaerulina musiva SO2202]EMF17714.1 FAD/NAD(P)-binding domain-containing protein [Sphaerulina musiva SO2202]
MGRDLHVGIVGAGIGGVLASIAMARVGCKVTVLEAAEQLGEIGAGIQMTPNVARLLIRYGVDKVIGDDLVRITELNLRKKDGTKVGYTAVKRVEDALGYPWWLVHRHHLHNGLVEVARQSGVNLIISSRVASISQCSDGRVEVATQKGVRHTFDLVVGSDGVQSVVRRSLFPNVKPRPPTGNCAYRAIVPYEEVRNDPITRELVEDANGNPMNTMEVWMASTGYIISYPISGGKDFNMVLSHFRSPPVDAVQEVSIDEVRQEYKDYDPRIKRVVEMIQPPISRWPLLVTGPLDSWSNAEKNVVLVGDSAHSMVNHMAQGAATSMEDGAFLARSLAHVVSGSISLQDAIALYEKGRMPKARYKQQVSYLNGWIWHLPDGPAAEARNDTMKCELEGQVPIRSANLYGDPTTVLECYGYDAESHADQIDRNVVKGRDGKDSDMY